MKVGNLKILFLSLNQIIFCRFSIRFLWQKKMLKLFNWVRKQSEFYAQTFCSCGPMYNNNDVAASQWISNARKSDMTTFLIQLSLVNVTS